MRRKGDTSAWKAVWRYLKNLKMELPIAQQFHFWEFEETQNTNSREYKHPYVHCSIIYQGQDLEAAQVPVSR